MGNYLVNNKPMNDTCPISLEKINYGILLDCGHYYSDISIQKFVYNKHINDLEILCPLCRKKVKNKEIKKIFKNWRIINLKYDNWTQINILNLYESLYETFKLNKIKCNKNLLIYQPIFKIDNFYQPILIDTELLYNFSEVKKDKLIKNLFLRNIKTEHGDELNNFSKKYKAKFLDINSKISYFSYLSRIIPYRLQKYNKEIFNDYIEFYIEKDDNVYTYDLNDGNMSESFYYLNRSCKILFNSYILKFNTKIFLINKIYSIIYL